MAALIDMLICIDIMLAIALFTIMLSSVERAREARIEAEERANKRKDRGGF